MTQGVQELFDAALALSDEERLQLVAALMSSVDKRGSSLRDDSWLEEVQRRSAEYDTGEVKPIAWVKVKARAGQEMAGIEPSATGTEPLPIAARKLRPIGLARGEFVVPDDFDAPLPDDLLQAFEGR